MDRIVAHIEGDTSSCLSEERELAAYQQLIDGRSQGDDHLVDALIEQWVVRNEAEQQAQFAHPPAAGVDAEIKLHPQPLSPICRPTAAPFGRRRTHRANVAPNRRAAALSRAISLITNSIPRFRWKTPPFPNITRRNLHRSFARRAKRLPPLDDVREQIREPARSTRNHRARG